MLVSLNEINGVIKNLIDILQDSNKEELSLFELQVKYPELLFNLLPKKNGFMPSVYIRTQGNKIEYLGAIKGVVSFDEAIKYFNEIANREYDKYY